MVFYNEDNPQIVRWLNGLMDANLIPQGKIDARSIEEIMPNDVAGFSQAHFFAGIGGWPYALELAGWPANRPVWTGSCPCQPFSCAGKHKGAADKRHLWPIWRERIAECRPATVFGEQVASNVARDWLAGVRSDLEALGYEVGAADLCAAGIGAPHIRQRLYWVAQSQAKRWRGGDNRHSKSETRRPIPEVETPRPSGIDAWSDYTLIPMLDGKTRRIKSGLQCLVDGVPFRLADGRTKEGTSRVALLMGLGNAIVPQLAAAFIRAFMETESHE